VGFFGAEEQTKVWSAAKLGCGAKNLGVLPVGNQLVSCHQRLRCESETRKEGLRFNPLLHKDF
jgi:hypothetical protein